MFGKDEFKKINEKLDELSDKIDKISDRQNSQFTDIVLQLKEVRDEIKEKRENDPSLITYEGTEDPLYEDAKEVVISNGKVSASYLQRKLGVAYSRAVNLIDTLEEEGIIGPKDGSRLRVVINEKDNIH